MTPPRSRGAPRPAKAPVVRDLTKKRTRRAQLPAQRDNDPSTFAHILADLVARVPGALGAVMVDGIGEAVDYAGDLETFDLKLAGAHWQIVLAQVNGSLAPEPFQTAMGRVRALVIRGARRSFLVHALPDEYALVVLLSRRAGFTAAARAYAVCKDALASEAGWRIRALAGATTWFGLDIVANRAGRPSKLRHEKHDHSLEIVGQIIGASIAPRERGWRVRLENGAELTIVREPGGHWYGDEALAALFSAPSPARTL